MCVCVKIATLAGVTWAFVTGPQIWCEENLTWDEWGLLLPSATSGVLNIAEIVTSHHQVNCTSTAAINISDFILTLTFDIYV